MGNSSGGSAALAINKYDKLPHSVKLALQNAKIDWACGWVYRKWERGMPAKKLVKYIEKIDRAEAVKKAKRTWGPDYPLEYI